VRCVTGENCIEVLVLLYYVTSVCPGVCVYFSTYIVQILPCQIHVHCIHFKFFNPTLSMSLSVFCLSLLLSLCPFFISLNVFLVLSIPLSLSFSIPSSLSLPLYPFLSTPPSLPLLLSLSLPPCPFLSIPFSFLSIPLSIPSFLSLPLYPSPCPSLYPFLSIPPSTPSSLLSILLSAYEILFSDAMTGAQIPQGATSFMGEEWASWTLTLGWAVQVRAILRRRRKVEKYSFLSILFRSSFTLALILTCIYLSSPLLHSSGTPISNPLTYPYPYTYTSPCTHRHTPLRVFGLVQWTDRTLMPLTAPPQESCWLLGMTSER
jgi:hypothetical protein